MSAGVVIPGPSVMPGLTGHLVWLDTIDSTNTEALRRLPELPSGSVLAAREQTAGRGQRGNTWFSEPGRNLTFSIVLKDLPLTAPESVRLNFLASLAVVSYLESRGVGAAVKWPNDIYVGGRKICGMLLENRFSPEGFLAASVVGIGINVNQLNFSQLANATSMARCTGQTYDLPAELAAFLAVFEGLLPRLGDLSLREEYVARLFRLGVSARYHDLLRDCEFTGIIRDVDPAGRLHVEDAGVDRSYGFKEISFLL